jgi:hypothetical protein
MATRQRRYRHRSPLKEEPAHSVNAIVRWVPLGIKGCAPGGAIHIKYDALTAIAHPWPLKGEPAHTVNMRHIYDAPSDTLYLIPYTLYPYYLITLFPPPYKFHQ